MATERLSFDIFAQLRDDGFAKASRAAKATSDDVTALSRRLDELSRKSATARVGLAGNKEALAQLDALDVKLLRTGGRVADPKITLEGAVKAGAELAALDVGLDKFGSHTEDASTSALGLGANLGKLSNLAMPAAIGAGVALSPVLVTLAAGMGGFGAAAVGVIKPITDAASKTGGLRANMASLNPVQQALARDLLGLGHQFSVFSKSLQPEVVSGFATAVHIAGQVMHDVQPVAKVTGAAFDQLLGQFGATLQDPQWRQFWAFMARTAPQDMQLLGNVIIDLANTLPGLIEDLQPVATGILRDTDAVLKLVDAGNKLIIWEHQHAAAASDSSGALGHLADAAKQAFGQFLPGATAAGKLQGWLARLAGSSGEASAGIGDLARNSSLADPPINAMAQSLHGAAARAFDMKNAVAVTAPVTDVLSTSLAGAAVHAFTMKERFAEAAASAGSASPKMTTFAQTTAGAAAQAAAMNLAVSVLTSSLNKMISPILTLEGDQVSFRQAQQAATAAINANKHGLDSNRASALAARTAVIQSTQAAITFAGQEVTVHHNVQAASDILRAQIQYLQTHAGKSRIAAEEIDALRKALNSLPASVRANVDIIGHGRGGISYNDQIAGQRKTGFLEFHAAGGLVGGPPGVDRTPIMASRGEVVVPTHMVDAGAVDHLRGRLPGFAAGGLIGNRSVLDRGIPYVAARGAAFEKAIMAITASEVRAAARRAAAAFLARPSGGGGGGLPANWRAIASFLNAHGFTRFAAAGVAGNIEMESGGNPEALQGGGSGGGGLIQWTPISAYPGYVTGNYGRDFSRQMNAILRWGGGPGRVNQARSAAQAAEIYQDVYERPASLTASLGGRIASANAVYRAMGWGNAGGSGGVGHRIFDTGGWLQPGWNPPMYNGTGRPEALVPAGRSGGQVKVVLEVHSGPGGAHAFDQFMTSWMKKNVRVQGAGNVQAAFGTVG